jgi:hypothetical protein
MPQVVPLQNQTPSPLVGRAWGWLHGWRDHGEWRLAKLLTRPAGACSWPVVRVPSLTRWDPPPNGHQGGNQYADRKSDGQKHLFQDAHDEFDCSDSRRRTGFRVARSVIDGTTKSGPSRWARVPRRSGHPHRSGDRPWSQYAPDSPRSSPHLKIPDLSN